MSVFAKKCNIFASFSLNVLDTFADFVKISVNRLQDAVGGRIEKMDFVDDRTYFMKLAMGVGAFSVFIAGLCVCTLVLAPATKFETPEIVQIVEPIEEVVEAEPQDYDALFTEDLPKIEIKGTGKENDAALTFYKQPETRSAVEWFYTRVTNSREITQAILIEAEKYDIPPSLAFALAHTESEFRSNAMHKNANGSVDRGLFQLNSSSFPKLTESDFYDPRTSAHYGLSHLRFCLNTAGNEIAALAMYNAGTTKVTKNNTPQTTLNYISRIQNYKLELDENFAQEVIAVYSTETQNTLLAKQ